MTRYKKADRRSQAFPIQSRACKETPEVNNRIVTLSHHMIKNSRTTEKMDPHLWSVPQKLKAISSKGLVPGYEAPWLHWKCLNRLRTGMGRYKSNMLKWKYMNDMCSFEVIVHHYVCGRYIMSGNDWKSLIQSVNSELCLQNTWLKANKLSLNVNKTYYLVFHRARIKVDNDTSIRMNESIINSASYLKYLGVIIDSKLNWIPHITFVKNKISKGIGMMFRERLFK